jgi:Domain of unknown function (DUF4160)
MPNFANINGIRINIYNGETHVPPHIHAEYAGDEVLLVIGTGEIYEGWLPGKQLRRVRQWLAENRRLAAQAFRTLNPHLYAPRKSKT